MSEPNEGGPVVPLNPPTPNEVLVRFRQAYEGEGKLMSIVSTRRPTSVTEELAAMSAVVDALNALDQDAQERVATWVFDRFARPRMEEREGMR